MRAGGSASTRRCARQADRLGLQLQIPRANPPPQPPPPPPPAKKNPLAEATKKLEEAMLKRREPRRCRRLAGADDRGRRPLRHQGRRHRLCGVGADDTRVRGSRAAKRAPRKHRCLPRDRFRGRLSGLLEAESSIARRRTSTSRVWRSSRTTRSTASRPNGATRSSPRSRARSDRPRSPPTIAITRLRDARCEGVTGRQPRLRDGDRPAHELLALLEQLRLVSPEGARPDTEERPGVRHDRETGSATSMLETASSLGDARSTSATSK